MTKAEKIAVLFQVSADYHSGMSSRGYRLLCRSHRWLRKNAALQMSGLLHLNTRQRALYRDIEARYGAGL